jgi:hypothetical protein
VPSFPGQREPTKPGNELAVKHGAFSARLLVERTERIAGELRRILPAGGDCDEPSVRLLAFALSRIEATHEWLDAQPHGLFRDAKGTPQPILDRLSTWERQAARLCDRLGLTSAGRLELGVDIAQIHELTRRRQLLDDGGEKLDLSALSPGQRAEIARLVVPDGVVE